MSLRLTYVYGTVYEPIARAYCLCPMRLYVYHLILYLIVMSMKCTILNTS